MKGVSRQAVTIAAQRGSLAKACIGKRIDLDHPEARKYLGGGDVAPPSPPKPPPEPAPAPTAERPKKAPRRTSKAATPSPKRPDPPPARKVPPPPEGTSEELEELAEAIRPLLEKFGTHTAFKDWLAALKSIEDIREKRLRNEETDGRLIARELVKHHVFGAIDSANRRLLLDVPKTVARRIYALAKSGASLEEAEQAVRDVIGSQLRPVKSTASRVLRNA